MKIKINEIVTDSLNQLICDKMNQFDFVEEIHIQQNNGYKIQGKLDVLSDEYNMSVDLDEQCKLIHFECSCSSNKVCAHVGHLLNKINDLNVENYPFDYTFDLKADIQKEKQLRNKRMESYHLQELTSESRKMIEQYKKSYLSKLEQVFKQELVEIEPMISTKYGMELSFKVGYEKKYVVKNISQFLEWIRSKSFHSYGKQLEFHHSIDNFDEFAKKQISFMSDIEHQKLQSNSYYENNSIGREIVLNERYLDSFYECYENDEGFNFKCEDNERKIKLQWKEYENYNELSSNEDLSSLYFGLKHLYQIHENKNEYVFSRIKLDEEGNARKLLKELSNQSIKILKKDSQDFYKYVLSGLMDYFDISNFEEYKENEIQTIKVFGDINDEGNVSIKVEYVDNMNNRIHGLMENNSLNYQQDIVESFIKKYASRIENGEAILESNQDSTINFVEDGLPFLQQYSEIYISDALKRFNERKKYHVSVGVRYASDLLSLNIESEDLPKDEISSILAQYRKKKKFYRLKNGDLIHLDSPTFDELSQMIDHYHLDMKDLSKGEVKINPYRLFSIENDAQTFENIYFDREESFINALDNFNVQSIDQIQIPKQYDKILRDYQKYGVRWMKLLKQYGFNGILADDMGLGKTLQVITLIEDEKSEKPSIVVVPSSLVYNWMDEITRFSKKMKAICVVGNKENRKQCLSEKADLYITSYDYMRRDEELYENVDFNYVILDEAQYIKNQKTQNALSVKKLKAAHKLALTGTPIENSLAELWSIFDFLMPGYLYNYHYFLNHYENDIVKNDDEETKIKLKKLVEPFILRRNKKEVLKELPDKTEKTLAIDFSESERDLYLAHLASVNLELSQMMGNNKMDKIAVLAMMTRLRQICCEPRLLFDNIYQSSSKMKACVDLVLNLKENKQKTLIFSAFTSVLDLIEEELNLMNISSYKLTGQTSKEARRDLIARFQSDDTDVFLISLKAGGTGLNLTAASAVIHFDPWWNVSAQNQATDRTYRIGQENNVLVFKLVMKNSIEEKILKLQEMKKNLADTFVENNEGSISKMNKDDILELFKE